MTQLNCNFTNQEQSKRLLELGVPAWTADCYYKESGKIEIKNTALDTLYPSCWSVGRLIEILAICCGLPSCTIDWVSFCEEQSPLQAIYDELCEGVTQGLLDFNKLKL